MEQITTWLAVIIGFPIIGGSAIAITALLRGWWLKSRELKIQERRIAMEERIQQDELNAKILRMDDYGLSASDIAALTEQIRQLQSEIADIRRELNVRHIS